MGGPAATGTPAAHRSSLLIRNAAAAGNRILVTFFDQTGTTVAQAQGLIAASGSARFESIGALPAGWSGNVPAANFHGSAIVSATRPMMVVHEISTERGARDAHPGIALRETDTALHLPLVRSNFQGVSSRIHVQNVGDKPTRVFIGFRPQRFGNVGRSGIASLAPGQSGEIALADLDLLDASGTFRGSAGISSTDSPIAAIVIDDVLAAPQTPALNVYTALGTWAASTRLQVPLYLSHADRNLATHDSDWSTVLAITHAGNPGDPRADVQIVPGENVLPGGNVAAAAAALPDLKPCDALIPLAGRSEGGLAPRETIYVELEGTRPCRFAGPVTITSPNAQPLVALVMHASASDASSLPALPEAYAASEILIPLVRSGVGAAQLYTEITARNVGSTEALVSIAFSPNLIPGGGQPNDAQFFVGPGGVFHYTDLQLRGIHYEGSATLRTDNGQPLAAAVSEVAVNRSANDALSSYPVPAADKTLAHLKRISLPDALIVPLLGPCGPFAAAMTQARDTNDPNGVTIPANVLRPLLPLGPQNCFETDDEELNNQAYAYGIKVTGNLQSFFEQEHQVVSGPLPFLLLSTRPQFGVWGSNDSEAALATLRSTAKSRITAGRWGGYAGAAALTVAAAALAVGASQLRLERLSKIDWTAGPADFSPGATGPAQKSAGLEHALSGDSPSDEETPYMQKLFSDIRDFMWGQAASAPQPPPESPKDPCKNGSIDLELLDIAAHFVNANMSFVKIPASSSAILTIDHMFPKRDGFKAMCELVRGLTSCVRSRNLQHLDIVVDIQNTPSEVIDMLERFWPDSHRNFGPRTDIWSIDTRRPDPSGCVVTQ